MATKTRNYAFIGYPDDGLPEEYELLLNALHTPWVESPLHQPDGEHDKPHKHFIVMFSGPRTLTSVREDLKGIPANDFVLPVSNLQGMTRYLIHLDNPDKEQFKEGQKAIICHCGADISRAFAPTATEHSENLRDIIKLIRESNKTNFAEFIDYLLDTNQDSFIATITDKYCHFIDAYFRSLYYRRAEDRAENKYAMEMANAAARADYYERGNVIEKGDRELHD